MLGLLGGVGVSVFACSFVCLLACLVVLLRSVLFLYCFVLICLAFGMTTPAASSSPTQATSTACVEHAHECVLQSSISLGALVVPLDMCAEAVTSRLGGASVREVHGWKR